MSDATLLIRCAGPMQSWGTRSRFGERDTETEPTKSGVCGLLAAAMGRSRSESPADLGRLRMAVRIDRPGHVESDYQTAGGGDWRGGAYGVAKASGASPETALSRRYYLADADFLVALEGDAELLERAQEALASPRWPLFLGRRGYAPGLPPYVPGGLLYVPRLEALRTHQWPQRDGEPIPELTAVVECNDGQDGDPRSDVPLSFDSTHRGYAQRRVRRIVLTPKGV